MRSAIKLETYMASTGILGVVVGKFRYKKKPCPIILLEVNKGLEVSFHCTILPFRLAIRLRVEGNGEFSLDAKEIT